MSNPNFIDYVKIFCKSGNGGKGSSHFRREKFAPKGGPDGGDGGRGGNIILKGNKQLWTLLHLKFTKHVVAENGGDGSGSKKYGSNGKDTIIEVPLGTIAKSSEKSKIKLLAELLVDHNYIHNSEKWLKHFDNNALAKANSDPIDWQKNTYELQYLIRDLKAKALITYPVSYEKHFTVKGKPLKNLGGGIHDPTKLEKIKAIIIKIT